MKNILCIVGTRPEVIKMAPLIHALKKDGNFLVSTLATAQHRELLDQMLKLFEIRIDIDLNVMQHNQKLSNLTTHLLQKIDHCLESIKPDMVIAQGDTTSVFVTGLACFYRKIPFAHLEAGLRSHHHYSPFPEEMNRVLADYLATLYFAPTTTSKQNLISEGINKNNIHVTGNTVIDALFYIANKNIKLDIDIPDDRQLIVLTAHRRENFGEPLINICKGILQVVEHNPQAFVLFPVHPNPNVRATVYKLLAHHPQIKLCEPLDYLTFVLALKKAYLVLSDSGGLQEEAPALGKPVLILRDNTERPEAMKLGVTKLIGTEVNDIFNETHQLLNDADIYRGMAKGISPYGDGHSSERIVKILKAYLRKV